MASSKEVFLVFGATGNQGGATVRALLDLAPSSIIHVLVRDPSSTKAQNLQSLASNIRLFPGDHDSSAALSAAAKGVTAAFINVSMVFTDFGAEYRFMQNILNALKETPTVKQIVYSSVVGATDPSVPGNLKDVKPDTFQYAYYESKIKCEKAVQETAEQQGWGWTILQPTVFMTNWLSPLVKITYPNLAEHKIKTTFPADWSLFWIDPTDIGRFAAHGLLGKESLRGQKVHLADECLTTGEVADRIARVMKEKYGKEVNIAIEHIPIEEAERIKDVDIKVGSDLNQWKNATWVDLDKVKSHGIELGTMQAFFEKEHERLKEALAL